MIQTPERERIAKIEIGQTDISPALAWLLVGAFLLTIALVPLIDLATGRATRSGVSLSTLAEVVPTARREGWLAGSHALLRQMHQFESGLEKGSFLSGALLPLTQRVLTALGVGNEKVYLGRAGGERWLYYAPDLRYVTGPGFLDPATLRRRRLEGEEWEAAPRPDPLPALVDFRRQLARRGIALIVMPAPVKPMIEPEGLTRHGTPTLPLQNPSWPDFAARLRAAGIELFDPAPLLAVAKGRSGAPQFLRTDTHWAPRAMDLVAGSLAERVRSLPGLSPATGAGYFRQAQAVSNLGDLAVLLTLPASHPLKSAEKVTIQRVQTAEGLPWKADPRAEVLLLGDSFTNIYSQSDLGWGTGAGLAEQLAYHLGRPVDRLALNSGGAYTTRQRLAQELAAGNDRLAGKKVVIYELAARELAIGDWKLIRLDGR